VRGLGGDGENDGIRVVAAQAAQGLEGAEVQDARLLVENLSGVGHALRRLQLPVRLNGDGPPFALGLGLAGRPGRP
jgi:hypothetical protein